jgi:hypothetical protein
VHRFIESFISNLWLTIGHKLHKIGWRDRKIPISKIGRRAWQNWTNFGCSCKWAIKKFLFNYLDRINSVIMVNISKRYRTEKMHIEWTLLVFTFLLILLKKKRERVLIFWIWLSKFINTKRTKWKFNFKSNKEQEWKSKK